MSDTYQCGVGVLKTEQEPLNLADLNGAVLVWEDKDGEDHRVEL